VPALVPIVEGRSEVLSLPLLIRRVWQRRGIYLDVARPVLAKSNQVVREGELEKRLAIAERDRPGAGAVLLVLDADDDCATELASFLLARASAATRLPVRVALPVREFEAFFLAAAFSLRGHRGIREDAEPPSEPEVPRDAKGAVTGLMAGSRRYVEVADQPSLTAAMDLAAVAERCRPYRKLEQEILALALIL
jgi:hypothetical protein